MKKLLQLILGVISHLLLTSTSLAQENAGTIYGTVTSEWNEAVALSTITLIKKSEIVAGIITDNEGNFILGEIEPGIYDLKISSVGFSSTYIRQIEIIANEVHIPPVQLSYGIQFSSPLCSGYSRFCNKPCGHGCLLKGFISSSEFGQNEPADHAGIIQAIDTLNYLSLESWRW